MGIGAISEVAVGPEWKAGVILESIQAPKKTQRCGHSRPATFDPEPSFASTAIKPNLMVCGRSHLREANIQNLRQR
jgi:hypothetical protein